MRRYDEPDRISAAGFVRAYHIQLEAQERRLATAKSAAVNVTDEQVSAMIRQIEQKLQQAARSSRRSGRRRTRTWPASSWRRASSCRTLER